MKCPLCIEEILTSLGIQSSLRAYLLTHLCPTHMYLDENKRKSKGG